MKKIIRYILVALVALILAPTMIMAQTAGEIAAGLTPDQIDTIINGAIWIVTLFVPAVGAKLMHLKMLKDQLLQVVKDHDSANESFIDVAKENKNALAAKAIEMAIDNSPKVQKFLKFNPVANLIVGLFRKG